MPLTKAQSERKLDISHKGSTKLENYSKRDIKDFIVCLETEIRNYFANIQQDTTKKEPP